MINQLKFQPAVVELCGLSHLLLVIGDARDQVEVTVDNPANPRGAADAKNPLSLRSLS